jgi:hypothetical protein
LKHGLNERDAAVKEELDRRVRELQALDRAALDTLPEESTSTAEVLGKPVQFTTFVSRDYPGKLIVLVRSDEPWLAIMRTGSTAGFWVAANGERTPASDDDVLDFFG